MLESIADVRKEYEVDDNGLIRNPGPFEIEPAWVVVANEYMLDGGGESFYNPISELTECTYWDTDEEMRGQLELDSETVAIVIYHSEQGFVSGVEMTQEEYDIFLGQIDIANNEFAEMDCDW